MRAAGSPDDPRAGSQVRPPQLTALVTGASSGIGRALALQLARGGASVIALGRDTARLQALQSSQQGITPLAIDLADIDAIPRWTAHLVERHPALSLVIANAGVQEDVRFDAHGYDLERMRHELTVNLLAPMALAHALLPHLRGTAGATFVAVTSGLAFAPKRTAAVYSASKAGLHLFAEALRVQLPAARHAGVRIVEAVMPLVDTPMTAGRGTGKLPPDAAAAELLAGLARGDHVIHVGKARWLPLLQRWAPRVLARVLQSG